ncbi:MAG: glutathione S-transferase family protein [Methyloligellaceae bacterium]
MARTDTAANGRLTLVGWYRSPYARRVAITMRHYGLDYDHRPITAWDRFDDVAAVNPIVKVPVLITEDGQAIPESAAILDYLDCRVGPGRALTPPPGPLRDDVRRIVAVATAVIDKARELRYEVHLRPETLRYDAFVDRWCGQISSAIAALDALVEPPHAAGETFTQADVTLGVMYDMVQDMHPGLLPRKRYPRLDILADAYRATPEFQATALEPVERPP